MYLAESSRGSLFSLTTLHRTQLHYLLALLLHFSLLMSIHRENQPSMQSIAIAETFVYRGRPRYVSNGEWG